MQVISGASIQARFFTAFLFLLVFFGSIFPITDNDVWWHLKSGQLTVQNREIQRRDVFSYTIEGRQWVNYEWLSDAAFYMVFSVFSLAGMTIFKSLIVLAAFILMYLSIRRKEPLSAWIIFAVAFFAMRDGLRERPQIFTYLFTAAYMWALRSKRPGNVWVLPFIQLLWANLHGAASLIGLGLVSLYCIADSGLKPRSRLALFAAVAGACFINPFGYGIFAYFKTFFSSGFAGLIMEWKNPSLTMPFAFFFALLAVSALSFAVLRKKASWETWALFIAAAASLAAIRNIPVFAVIAAPLTAENLGEFIEGRGGYGGFNADFLRAGLLGAALLALFWIAGAKLDTARTHGFGLGDAHKCKYAAEFVKSCTSYGFKGPIFNDFDFGGYLIWKLYPMQKVFIDGRLVEYGRDMVEKSFYFWKPEVWRELEGRYGFTGAVVPNERYYSCAYLDSLKDWVLVYWDDNALVYFKDIPQNHDFIEKYGYRILKPNRPDQGYLKEYPVERTLFEIERSLYFSPSSRKAAWMKAYISS